MLENEPARRYGSVRQVADDIERYREGRPILGAAANSLVCHAQVRHPALARGFRRHRWPLLALAALTAFSVHQTAQAREQAARAQRVSEFVKNTFLSASSTWNSPLRGQSRAIQFNDILDNAAERVGRELSNDPLAEADLRGTIGMTYSILGDPVKGEVQIRRALDVLKRTPGGILAQMAADLRFFCATPTPFRAVTPKRSRPAVRRWHWLACMDPI